MKISFEKIAECASGVSYCEENDGKLILHRFSKETENVYNKVAPEYKHKLTAGAGIALRFVTDSDYFFMTVNVSYGSTRTYFAYDVFVNGKYFDSLQNFKESEMNGNYPAEKFPLGDYEKKFIFEKGKKEITVLFPALVSTKITALEIEDGCCFYTCDKKKTYLALGDSITQGYDCKYPKNRYEYALSQKFDLYEKNLAIGGDIFRNEMAKTINEQNVSLITVAYGSNDWSNRKWEAAENDCKKYLESIYNNFRDIPVYVIAPIWRGDFERNTEYGEFNKVSKLLKSICEKYDNFNFVDGFDFVAHNSEFFGDGYLHPNDNGFNCYAESLISKIDINNKSNML